MVKNRLYYLKKDILNNKRKLVLSALLLLTAAMLSIFSGFYVDKVGIAQPKDIIVSNIPVIDFSYLIVFFSFLTIFVFILYPLLYDSKNFHLYICLLSLFLIIKSVFSILTHLRVPSDALLVSHAPFFYYWFSFPNNLFFSGQTGFTFLGFLLFKERKVKIFMLLSSIILSLSVLFMHLHYSIDVIAAYFITYGIYKLGVFIFEDGK